MAAAKPPKKEDQTSSVSMFSRIAQLKNKKKKDKETMDEIDQDLGTPKKK